MGFFQNLVDLTEMVTMVEYFRLLTNVDKNDNSRTFV